MNQLDPETKVHPVDRYVGQNIQAARKSRGFTQADIAEKLKVSFQQVQKYESGSNRISASKLYEISNILNVSPGSFFGEFKEQQSADHECYDPETLEVASLITKTLDHKVKNQIFGLIRLLGDETQTQQA